MTTDRLQSQIRYRFKRNEFLQQALSHRSYSRNANNERLEFLGDSVLSLIISNVIYRRFGEASEGRLSRIRASLVKQETLAEVARGLQLGDCILLGGGELKSGGFRRDSILADALEALIAAIYLDSGYGEAERVVLALFDDLLQGIDVERNLKDPKTRLQELLQAKQQPLPVYRVLQTTGKSHDQVFTVCCEIEAPALRFEGQGSSRKKAEQEAARKLLNKLQA